MKMEHLLKTNNNDFFTKVKGDITSTSILNMIKYMKGLEIQLNLIQNKKYLNKLEEELFEIGFFLNNQSLLKFY